MHDAASIVYEKENDKYVTIKDVLEHNDATIDSLNNRITAITNDVINLNTNNILIPQRGDDIILNKNQDNILFEPINANNIKINIKFDKDEYDHEYNFKFILSRAANEVYLNMDGWFIPGRDRLFINNNNDNIKITYNAKNNTFVLTREDDIKNVIMCDITINKYSNESYGICTMSCKIYNYLG